jgi:predicted DNA-binding protein (MmcQ/YjbR family)
MAETFPFGAKTSVFKVAGKMFALSQLAEYRSASAPSASRSSPSTCARPTRP